VRKGFPMPLVLDAAADPLTSFSSVRKGCPMPSDPALDVAVDMSSQSNAKS
jgi:hypothetical protein